MNTKATTIKEALKRLEDRTKTNPCDDKEIDLCFQWPPIEKMDTTFSTLVACEKLSLSTNMIDKIFGLSGMKNLRVLSLGRNYIKAISGLEGVSDTLEELWLSYNLVEKLKGINVLKKLKVLYMSNNLVKDWVEFNRLVDLPVLEDLLFAGNPLVESMEESVWRAEASKRLLSLRKLDGETVIREESDSQQQQQQQPGQPEKV
ncbi:dynein axonemal light chain 1 [Toxorhynchites rutilus septentrionalis]|uniref:dynein axonemal light chain 1 n=1 Tax=Toxorhynchites rutilus septentrionalis TaxID=329112 RepID=UPI00247845AB|nr:dynein axonemal light chain 1 [Toxorhynchites rutilus septentrionalis]